MPERLQALSGRYWRALGIRWQHQPFDSGSHLTGGRWNPLGTPALYLSADVQLAMQEMYQDLVRPATLVAFDLEATAIADLTGLDTWIGRNDWRTIFAIDKGTPPSWSLARQLIDAGAQGALVQSVQQPGGTNLVLWRWHDARESGDGARLTLLDPESALGRLSRK